MSYLEFKEIRDTGKTKVFSVDDKDGNQLGIIAWYAPWRKYVFGTLKSVEAVFDIKCLGEITNKIDSLMNERKKINKNIVL